MELRMKGDSIMTKLFTAILLGDFTAYYLALKYEIDPTPVEMVEHLKKML
jgi:glucose/mannose-6-phosphate isomerase